MLAMLLSGLSLHVSLACQSGLVQVQPSCMLVFAFDPTSIIKKEMGCNNTNCQEVTMRCRVEEWRS